MYEHCGVIGIYSFEVENIVPMLLASLESLQHRGQESWGIAVPGYPPFKRLGIVAASLETEYERLSKLTGNTGIGHVRYSTTAKSTLDFAHPLDIGGSSCDNSFCIAHNGTLDRDLLAVIAKKNGFGSNLGMSDTELLGKGIYENRKKGMNWSESFDVLNPYLNGSFSMVILTVKGELLGVRDEIGFRPLCLGWHEETHSYIIASESCAFDILGAKLVRDIKPGEIITVNENGLKEERFSENEHHAHCAFEYTYFANPGSRIEGINIYSARKNIGRQLARKYPLKGDIVIPVPDSARPAALGYSEKSGVPFEEGLMKDRYKKKASWRSFIEPEKREDVVSNIIAIKEIVRNKRIILIDDSIVRGTSSKIIIGEKLRDAKEVSLLLTFPPISYPCYAGIDFPTQEELLIYRVCGESVDLNEINSKVAEHIGVSELGYNDVDNLSRGIGLPKEHLCLSCTTGDYSCLKRRPNFKTKEKLKS